MSYFKGVHFPCRAQPLSDFIDVAPWGSDLIDLRTTEGSKTAIVRLSPEQARELAKRLSAWAGEDAPSPPKPWSDL